MTTAARLLPAEAGRVLEVLTLLAEGRTLQQIARDWDVEPGTVRIYAARLRRYLGADTNPQAVFLACQAGILAGRPRRECVDIPFDRQVLLLAANGMTDREIAEQTGASLSRVLWVWRRLKAELGARDRTHAVVLAIRARRIGLSDLPPAAGPDLGRQTA